MPTTRLCAEALERRLQDGQRWVDLGCGTALLSMVAVHSGAAEVLAVDVDPEAIAVAREVLQLNGLLERVGVAEGSTEVVAAGAPWDGVVANIAGSYFLGRAVETAGVLCEGGLLIASGVLVDDVPEIESALTAAGLRRVELERSEAWAVLLMERVREPR